MILTYDDFLFESLNQLDSVVDYIYTESNCSRFITDFNAGKKPYFEEIKYEDDVVLGKFESSEIIDNASERVIFAHLSKPVTIKVGIFNQLGSYYKPSENYIQASFNYFALSTLYFRNTEFENSIIFEEITEDKIKGTLAHEISHWVDDALYGQITKYTTLAKELNRYDILKLGKANVNMTHYEINSQIHQIKDFKRRHEHEWNELSFTELVEKIPALYAIKTQLNSKYSSDAYKIWLKLLFKRMNREGLIGKSMR